MTVRPPLHPPPQKPTVGRQVHYYGLDLYWHQESFERDFSGPFAATVVRVHADGTVNLNVLFPSEVTDRNGHEYVSEIVENIPYASHADTAVAAPDRAWVWPPRVST